MDVSPFQHIVGGIAAQNAEILFALGDLESRCLRRRLAQVRIDRPIFVTGLARAGTTILLELLAGLPGTASFRYMDFPLVMIPYWWGRYLARYRRREAVPVERSHADGLRVTPASPEAMEEILWMHFFPGCHDPGRSNVMDETERHPAFEAFYADAIRKVLLEREARRYTAKNNYNLVRLQYLRSVFPDARFVVPVRDPRWHVASLMKQQRLLERLETEDRRVLAYMRRAGHFEFGLDRRPINAGDAGETAEIRRLWREGEEARGWARYWAALHRWLEEQLRRDTALADSVCLVDYERLCREPASVLPDLYARLELGRDPALPAWQARRLHPPDYYRPQFSDRDEDAIRQATAEVHAALVRRASP